MIKNIEISNEMHLNKMEENLSPGSHNLNSSDSNRSITEIRK